MATFTYPEVGATREDALPASYHHLHYRTRLGPGTLRAAGEESFVVSRDGDGTVWFNITSFSRPARWFTRAAGPVVPLLQRAYARRCGHALRKLV